MNTTIELANLNIQKIKTKTSVCSLYGFSKNNSKYIIIPQDLELEVTEIYPKYGVDVFYGDRNIFLSFDQIEIVK